MKAKKLNQDLFGKMELNQADMKMVKGGDDCETVYSGRGLGKDGRMLTEYCTACDDGTILYNYLLATVW